MIVTLIGHLSMTDAHWSAVPYLAVMTTLAIVVLGQAAAMARRGPTSRLTVPDEWVLVSDGWTSSPVLHPTSMISSSPSELSSSTR